MTDETEATVRDEFHGSWDAFLKDAIAGAWPDDPQRQRLEILTLREWTRTS